MSTISPSASIRGRSSPPAPSIILGSTEKLGYTPFEYWKGPKPVFPNRAKRPPSTALNYNLVRSGTLKSWRESQQKIPESPSRQGKEVTHIEMAYNRRDGKGATCGFPSDARGPASFQVRDLNGGANIELVSETLPDSPTLRGGGAGYGTVSRWNPKYWTKRIWALVIVAIIVLIVIIAVPVAVTEQQKKNRYPDYTALNYTLADTYSGTSFFDQFDYFTGYDPTQGHVHYVPKEQAAQLNLTYASQSSALLKVDTSVGPGSVPDASTGRFSVRVESKRQYNSGLFIFDVKHTPYGCGTWPALWMSDRWSWPSNGEIDVMEAVNQADDGNSIALHTSNGCDMSSVKRLMSGTATYSNCYNGTNDNKGCAVEQQSASTYGSGFNSAGGGVMAMEWRTEGIRVWQFMRGSLPSDLSSGNPNPSSWGQAVADFPNTECNIGNHFRNQSIIINITLCGSWAGGDYASDGCPSNCTDYVSNNPSAFTNAFWEFGTFQVYQPRSS